MGTHIPKSFIRDEAVAYELARTQDALENAVRNASSLVRPLLLIGAARRKRRRIQEVEQRIKLASELHGDARVVRLFKGLASVADARAHAKPAKELRRLATMPGHEAYKYKPQSEQAYIASYLAVSLHSVVTQPAFMMVEDNTARPLYDDLTAIHATCGTSEVRRSMGPLDWRDEHVHIKTLTPFGFEIVESYAPRQEGTLNRGIGMGLPIVAGSGPAVVAIYAVSLPNM